MRIFFRSLLPLFLLSMAYAQNLEPVRRGHVHEAFMINEAPVPLLQAMPQHPPPALQENIPQQTNSEAIWIPGYWDWSKEHNEYIWCSGNWRLPPPGHQWVPGYWQQAEQGWVRVRGFWSQLPENQLVYIAETPPDVLAETPSQKPGKDFFWMPGYWLYENNQYQWYSGSWQRVDSNWVYVPPKYIWRADGFVFVPAFWDWPIEYRGTAYACVLVPKGFVHIEYTADLILEPQTLISECIVFFPDFCYFYFYYGYVHPEWLAGCQYCPPWLAWDWWWLPWYDQWGLWWWWCTPGYPAPYWLPQDAIHQFYPPPHQLVIAVRHVPPPVIVTPNGVVPPGTIFSVLDVKNKPIVPKNAVPIQKKAAEKIQKGKPERPEGPKVPFTDLEKKVKPLPKIGKEAPKTAAKGKKPELPKTAPRRPLPQKPFETTKPKDGLEIEKPTFAPRKPADTKPPEAPTIKKPDIPQRPEVRPQTPAAPVIPEKPRGSEMQVKPPAKPITPGQPQQPSRPFETQQVQPPSTFPSTPPSQQGPQRFQQPSMETPSAPQRQIPQQPQMQKPTPQPTSPPQSTSPMNQPSSKGQMFTERPSSEKKKGS